MPLPCSQKLVELYAITSAGAGSKEKKNQEEMNRKPEDIIRKKKEKDSILYMCAGI